MGPVWYPVLWLLWCLLHPHLSFKGLPVHILHQLYLEISVKLQTCFLGFSGETMPDSEDSSQGSNDGVDFTPLCTTAVELYNPSFPPNCHMAVLINVYLPLLKTFSDEWINSIPIYKVCCTGTETSAPASAVTASTKP
ncbi:hypothetical protein V8E55_011635 [Tylopilus felleus]